MMTLVSVFLLLFFAMWVICGYFAKWAAYTYMQREWSIIAVEMEKYDNRFSWFLFVAGPLGLISAVFNGCFFHGMVFKRFEPTDER